MVENKRVHPRIPTVTLFDVSAPGKLFYDYSTNVGEGGVYLETQEILEVGEKLELQFTLEGYDHVFFAVAQVAWVNQVNIKDQAYLSSFKGAGIKFVEIQTSDLKMFREYIEKTLNPQAT